MLRIETTTDGRHETFPLEGRLVGAWVDALRRAVSAAFERRASVSLDLDGVRFADDSGAALLSELLARGATIRKSSSFVAKLLETRES